MKISRQHGCFVATSLPVMLFLLSSSPVPVLAITLPHQPRPLDDPTGDETRTFTIYQDCSAYSWIPGDCPDGNCAPDPLASKIYQEWKRQFLELYSMTEQDFQDRISVRYMYFLGSAPTQTLNLHYMFTYDWLHVRVTDDIRFYHFPPKPWPPGASEIARAVASALPARRDFMIQEISPLATVKDAFRQCNQAGMTPDWCRIRYREDKEAGRWVVRAIEQLHDRVFSDDSCQYATVDVVSGRLLSCGTGPCAIQ